ncbi:MAG: tetratricopeptide repeat protein [Holophagales bacterium]|nr:tetratricopeptide repeat protein [Holophagales bacterium]MYC10660.1 tetratricopeptide repeat protein [Holophagales bacterium]
MNSLAARVTPIQPRLLSSMVLVLGASIASCTAYTPFDGSQALAPEFERRLGSGWQERVVVPFSVTPELRAAIDDRISPAGSETRRRDEVLDFIFGWLDLQYELTPTRTAAETFGTARGNCLSFVNLFVAAGRERRLNPFFVEVEDYQRWNYHNGVVVSRGHIVAGMYVDGNMATYDFLPYRPKSYRSFQPISDLAAAGHYYNNLGAEALMVDDLETAERWLDIAVQLAPDFDKAINNHGLVLLRTGRVDEAIEVYEEGLELHPESVPLLTNLVRAYQIEGRHDRAGVLLDALEAMNRASPFFYVYRGDAALAAGDTATALDYMRRALAADSELPEVHVGLVRVYLATGQMSEAKHHVERALRLDATHEEARKYAAMIERGAR